MTAYQLTIPVENAPGRLAQVSGLLKREKINIRAITISSFGESGFFNVLVDDPKLALKALSKEGIRCELQEVVAVLIDDQPGGMDSVVQLLSEAGVNIENAYGFVLESNKNAVFVIQTSALERAKQVLKEQKFKSLSTEALATIEPFHYMKY